MTLLAVILCALVLPKLYPCFLLARYLEHLATLGVAGIALGKIRSVFNIIYISFSSFLIACHKDVRGRSVSIEASNATQ